MLGEGAQVSRRTANGRAGLAGKREGGWCSCSGCDAPMFPRVTGDKQTRDYHACHVPRVRVISDLITSYCGATSLGPGAVGDSDS